MTTGPGVQGVTVRPLRRVDDERGALLHMLRVDDEAFQGFGEIYFSAVRPGAVKAWRRHRRVTSNLAVPVGAVRLVVHDAREGSPTAGVTQVIDTGATQYALVTIPPGVWTGWQCLGAETALVANCATGPHDPAEVDRLDADSPEVPYRWTR